MIFGCAGALAPPGAEGGGGGGAVSDAESVTRRLMGMTRGNWVVMAIKMMCCCGGGVGDDDGDDDGDGDCDTYHRQPCEDDRLIVVRR